MTRGSLNKPFDDRARVRVTCATPGLLAKESYELAFWASRSVSIELTEKALVEILTRPKNALIKQYKRLFEMDDVQLKFTPEALNAIARKALAHKAGARGLRSILENAMLDIMYEVPSEESVKEVVINEEVILRKETPLIVYEKEAQTG